MKYMNKYKWAVCLAMTSLVFTGCEKDDALVDANGNEVVSETTSDSVKDGYFTATLIPGIGNDILQSRTPVSGFSDQIQSLRFMLFKKGDDDVYTRYTDLKTSIGENVPEDIISFKSQVNDLYSWPLSHSVQLSLPVGDYKVVFLGNMDKRQFANQDAEIVQVNSGRFEDVRINMPDGGPLAFLPALNAGDGQYQNLFYLATADLNKDKPSPQILLQRIVTQSSFSRDFIDTDDAVGQLVQSVVDQVNREQLLEDIVEGVLRNELTGALTENLVSLTDPLLGDVVDALVNVLLGDILTLVNEALLQQVTDLLNESLHAKDSGDSLYTLLNPWSELTKVDASMDIVTSIDLNRVPRTVEKNKVINDIKLNNQNGVPPHFTVTLLSGGFTLNSATVTNEEEGLLRQPLGALDESVLAGLFINLCTPISYETGNNLQYTTNYDLLRLKLVDDTYSQEEKITLTVDNLETILDSGHLTESLTGHGLLGNLVDITVGQIVQAVVNRLTSHDNSLLNTIGIKLPNLAIGNITLEGRWGSTIVSDGTTAVSQIGERDENAAWKPADGDSQTSRNE